MTEQSRPRSKGGCFARSIVWNSKTTYYRDDEVYTGDKWYICNADSAQGDSQSPPNSKYWIENKETVELALEFTKEQMELLDKAVALENAEIRGITVEGYKQLNELEKGRREYREYRIRRGWKPKKADPKRKNRRNRGLMNLAYREVELVTYKVSVRYLYYRLISNGTFTKSYANSEKLEDLLSWARRHFYGPWTPFTLEDSVRRCYWKGTGGTYFNLKLDSILEQPKIVIMGFEAKAMHGQFEAITEPYRLSLIPFGGESSVPIRGEAGEMMGRLCMEYKKPVIFLYCGDRDDKGEEIYETAKMDMLEWCYKYHGASFKAEWIGLTPEQVKEFDLPENPDPDHPGSHQWEALSDAQAKEIILDALERHDIEPVSPEHLEKERKLDQRCRDAIDEALKRFNEEEKLSKEFGP
jgi:hypothetical protein